MLLSLLTVIPILFALRWGRWVDRAGVHGPMLAGIAAIFLAMVLGWLFPRLETLFVVSPLAGSGFFLYHIAAGQAAAMIGRPEDRIKNFSLLALAFSVSSFLGPTLSGFAIDGIGHANAMLALSAGVLVNLVALTVWKPDVPHHGSTAAHQEKRRVSDLLRIPGFRLVFIVSSVLSMTWDLFAFVMPIHGSQLGLSATTIGLILGAFGAAVFVVRLLLPLVAHRLDEWRMLITQPFIMALLYEKAPAGRGAEVLSVRTWLINVSQTGVPLMFGALGAVLGMLPAFWAMGASLLVAGWFATRGIDSKQ